MMRNLIKTVHSDEGVILKYSTKNLTLYVRYAGIEKIITLTYHGPSKRKIQLFK